MGKEPEWEFAGGWAHEGRYRGKKIRIEFDRKSYMKDGRKRNKIYVDGNELEDSAPHTERGQNTSG